MSYGIISEIGNTIVKILRDNMFPDTILNTDGIGLCSPDERGDITLSVYLYDIRRSEEVLSGGMKNNGIKKQTYPSIYLNLYYMITVYSMSDVKFRATEEQRMIGKVIQVLNDNSVITEQILGEGVTSGEQKIKIEWQQLDRHEKIRMWSFPNLPYKYSLFYKVYPIEIESDKTKDVSRVVDIDFTLEETKKGISYGK